MDEEGGALPENRLLLCDQSASYNRLDTKLNDIARQIESYLQGCNCIQWVRQFEHWSHLMLSFVQNYKSYISTFPICIEGEIKAVCIKGPSHPRKESDRIPYIYLQVFSGRLTPERAVMWKRKAVWEFKTPNGLERILVATRSATWMVKLKHFSGLSRLIMQTGADIHNLIRGQLVYNDQIQWHLFPHLKPGKGMSMVNFCCLLLVENFLMAFCSEPELEGFVANFRKLYHQSSGTAKEKRVYLLPGETLESKCSENLYNNAIALWMDCLFI